MFGLGGSLVGPEYSVAIDISSAFSLFEVGSTSTQMVFPFQRTVVHCCTKSVSGLVATIAVMQGRAGGCEYVVASM